MNTLYLSRLNQILKALEEHSDRCGQHKTEKVGGVRLPADQHAPLSLLGQMIIMPTKGCPLVIALILESVVHTPSGGERHQRMERFTVLRL